MLQSAPLKLSPNQKQFIGLAKARVYRGFPPNSFNLPRKLPPYSRQSREAVERNSVLKYRRRLARASNSATNIIKFKQQKHSGSPMGSERERELRRRRQRKKKMGLLRKRAEKASSSEKEVLAAKVRRLTPGAEGLIKTMGLK